MHIIQINIIFHQLFSRLNIDKYRAFQEAIVILLTHFIH